MIRRVTAVALGAVLAAGSAAAAAPPLAAVAPAADATGLGRLLAGQLSRFPARTAVYAKDLRTGEAAAVRGDVHFESASTIKLAVLVLAFRLADAGKLDLRQAYELRPQDVRPGSGVLRLLQPGARMSLHDLLALMIAVSDNTATDIMIAKVGGPEAVNAFLRDAGYRDLRLNKTVYEHFRWRYELLDPAYRTLSPEEVFALQGDGAAPDPSRQALIADIRAQARAGGLDARVAAANTREDLWLGVATARELGRMLESIERDEAASPAACADMRRMLRAQQAGARKIPHFLSVPVAHKTGENIGVTHDAGVIYARSGPIVLVSLNSGVQGPVAETEDRIGELARSVVDYFEGAR